MTTYLLGHDVIAQLRAAATSLEYMLYDGHGSNRGLVDATGEPLTGQIFAYDAYGNRLDTNNALTVVQYSGELLDTLTGNYYNRARFYNPVTGRFNRVDPYAGNIQDPQSLHKYLFTHGDPVNGTDPTGLFTLTELKTVSGIMTRLTSISIRVTRAINFANNVADAIQTISAISRLASGDGIRSIVKGIDRLRRLGKQDRDFGSIISRRGIVRGLETFAANSGRILGSIISQASSQQFANIMGALNNPSSHLVIFMPTPGDGPWPNPHFLVRTGLKLKLSKGFKRPVSLHFGSGGFRGRFIGVGVIPNTSLAARRKPFQFFRMDWHQSHGREDWIDGDFHFHVLDKRRRVKTR